MTTTAELHSPATVGTEDIHRFGRQHEARTYVYAVMISMLDAELKTDEGWMFGGVADEPSQRRLTKAIKVVAAELQRKVNNRRRKLENIATAALATPEEQR